MRIRQKHGVTGVAAFAVLAVINACGAKQQHGDSNHDQVAPVKVTEGVSNQDPRVSTEVTDGVTTFQVMGGQEVKRQQAKGALQSPASLPLAAALLTDDRDPVVPHENEPKLDDESLYVGFPLKLLGEGQLFGGVITKVSAKDNEALGRLKLTDLSPLHVRPLLARDGNAFAVVLNGCVSSCDESSVQNSLIGLPVIGVSEDKQSLVLDLSSFGNALNLMELLDPDGAATGLKTIATRTSYVDFSSSTLVFDVEHTMIAKDKEPSDTSAERVTIVVRYYLKSEAGLNSAFTVRAPTEGVGYFGTSRNKDEKINRWSLTSFNGENPVHYFVKNVPADHREAFALSFDHWNETFKKQIGRELLSYEFVEANDARHDKLVPGDVRYNILEWDVDNLAPYGGLGPSVASQSTGEIFSANVLIQGPSVLKIYKAWWNVAEEVKSLQEKGDEAAAQKRLVEGRRGVLSQLKDASTLPSYRVSLGKNLPLYSAASDPRYEDPAAKRDDFLALPDGMTYETYMKGYFQEMVTHELGHNLGLRHNFRGNLLADNDSNPVSASIMEYLNRSFRHRNKIGDYDRMAIAYAYAGVKPTRFDMFCTDENVATDTEITLSPECSRDDATTDPYGYLESVAQRAVDFLVNRGTPRAPEWTVDDVDSNLNVALRGLANYAAAAETNADKWTNWKSAKHGFDRPSDSAGIRAYVLSRYKAMLCGPAVSGAVAQKRGEEAKAKTQKNIDDLYAKVAKIAETFKLGDTLKCQ